MNLKKHPCRAEDPETDVQKQGHPHRGAHNEQQAGNEVAREQGDHVYCSQERGDQGARYYQAGSLLNAILGCASRG